MVMRTGLWITQKLPLLLEHLLFSNIYKRKQTFLPIITQTRQQNSSQSQRGREPQPFCSSPRQHLLLAYEVLRCKEVLREALRTPSTSPTSMDLCDQTWVSSCFQGNKQDCDILLTGLYKTSNSSSNRVPGKHIALYLFLVICRSFRIRIHSHSACMFMQTPCKKQLWYCTEQGTKIYLITKPKKEIRSCTWKAGKTIGNAHNPRISISSQMRWLCLLCRYHPGQQCKKTTEDPKMVYGFSACKKTAKKALIWFWRPSKLWENWTRLP